MSDKFAGQKGPCPKCKKPIEIPSLADEVVIHAPRDDSPKDSKGRSVLKAIKRTETRVTRRAIVVTVVTVTVMLGAAIGLRLAGPVHWAAVILGAILIAPPAIWAAYGFARDAELEPYVGADLRNRVLILSAIFASLWLIYAFVPVYLLELDKPSQMSLFMAGLMIVVVLAIGSFAAANTLELEFSGGLIVAGMYVVVALLLALIAGVHLASTEGRPKPSERELILPPQPAAMQWLAEDHWTQKA